MAAAVRRDDQGRFVVGNGGGPGRPKRQTEAGYLAVLMEECGLETWRRVVRRAVEDAADGNEKARSWLASYLVGAPSTEAPSAGAVVQQQLLGNDPALEAAAHTLAKIEAERRRGPALWDDPDLDLEAAEAAILAAEHCSDPDLSASIREAGRLW